MLRWLGLDSLIAIAASWLVVALRFDRLVPIDIYASLRPWVLLPSVAIGAANLPTGVYTVSRRRPSPANIMRRTLSADIANGDVLVVVSASSRRSAEVIGLMHELGGDPTSHAQEGDADLRAAR